MKILYLVAEDWYFLLHRVPTLRAAQRMGAEIVVVTRINDPAARTQIESLGARVVPFPFNRRTLNPFSALADIARLWGLYRRERPDIAHHIAIKPILFGTVAAMLCGGVRVVNGYVGLGTLFYGRAPTVRLIRAVCVPLLRFASRRSGAFAVFENGDDQAWMERSRIAAPGRSAVISGTGVDPDRFCVAPLPPSPPFICMFAGRMIRMKGLDTIRRAFALLRERDGGMAIHLWLCGMPDEGNIDSLSVAEIESWCAENPHVIWKGRMPDMSVVWPQVHLALQPTLGGEGLPVSLLEAAACARPMIATDVPGCREIARDGVNAVLIPEDDAPALAQAILNLAANLETCAAMGRASRDLVEAHFTSAMASAAIEAVYKKVAADE